jgi:hypothetical protein
MELFLNPILSFSALGSGFIFGFLLQKVGVAHFDTIVGQLLLRNFTVMKVILTGIVVGSLGIYSLHTLHLVPTLHLSKTPIFFSMLGGSIFGMGMSLTGYCPGTAIAALASGAKDMLFGLLGMIFGSLLFNELSFYLLPLMEQKDAAFQQTISTILSVPNWIVMLSLFSAWLVFVAFVDKLEVKKLVS